MLTEDSEQTAKVPTQVTVSFVTDLPEYEVEDAWMTVETRSDPTDLSKIINQLLGKEGDGPMFRFMLKEKFLRGSLKSHITANNLHSEETFVLKYDLQPLKPKLVKNQDQEDWVISVLSERKDDFIVNLCNGTASLVSGKDYHIVSKTELPGNETVKSAALIDVGPRTYLASGCQSGNLYWRNVTEKEIRQPTSMCRFDGAAIDCMDANPVNPSLLMVGLSTGKTSLVDSSKVQQRNVQFKKGLKILKTDMRVVEPESTGSTHTEGVTALKWTSANRFASASFDHNLKITDAENFNETWNVYLKDLVPTAIDYYPKFNSLLVGFEDGYIRLFDEKEKSKRASMLFKSHSKWISKLTFLPGDRHVFASASYDGLIKLWDIREELPLYTMTTHKDKVFDLAWMEPQKLIAGGTDNRYTVHECDFKAVV